MCCHSVDLTKDKKFNTFFPPADGPNTEHHVLEKYGLSCCKTRTCGNKKKPTYILYSFRIDLILAADVDNVCCVVLLLGFD